MISPSSFAVFALKFLQKSMILTPCGPSAVPTGGAGVAFPAAICSLTIACIFFAMFLVLPPEGGSYLKLLYLQKVQFDRRRAAEDGHHDLERVALVVHLVHHAVEAGERPLVDPHLVALLERVLRLRLLGRFRDLVQNLVDLFAGQ